VELAASNLELLQEIAQRKAAEEALQKSERHYSKLLENRISSRNSCGNCPARFSRPRRRSGKRSAANCMMS